MIKVFEAFAGYGGASFALKRIGIPHEVVGYSEIDKNAIKCYEQNHKGKNFGDITKINPEDIPDFDLFTGGFPCQAFSQAGKQLGELDTRGTLFREIIRICEVKKPKYMLLENVKGLTTKKFQSTFLTICQELERIGYQVRHRILNTKDFGIPQNRQRIYFVCIRKDLNQSFEWPEEQELILKVRNILEEVVDDKYFYSNNKRIEKILNSPTGKLYPLFELKGDTPSGISRQSDRIWNIDEISPCLNCTQKEYLFTCSNTSPREIKFNDVSPTLLARDYKDPKCVHLGNTLRKLTPIECFRLMGFTENQINLNGLSDSAKYKLAGNGWDINLVSKIFKQMFKEE